MTRPEGDAHQHIVSTSKGKFVRRRLGKDEALIIVIAAVIPKTVHDNPMHHYFRMGELPEEGNCACSTTPST